MARGGGAKASKGKRVSRSVRAGLTFPLGRVRTQLKKKLGKGRRLTWGAAAYTTAVIEYLSAEVLEIAGNVARDFKLRRMTPRHILLAVLNDQELAHLLKGVTIPSSGVLPFIHQNLLPKNKQTPSALTVATVNAASPSKGKPAKATAKAVTKRTAVTKPTSTTRKATGTTLLNEKTLASSGIKLSVLQGDIVDVACDALVNPSDASFSLTGQVGSRLAQVGGAPFQQIVQKALQQAGGKPIASTEAAITEGVGFGASYVIHCNGPQWGNSTTPAAAAKTIPLLEKTVQSCLRVADGKKLKSIAFPSIGSGVGGFPKHTAAEVILRGIETYFKETTKSTVKQVYFVLHDKDSVNVYMTELAKLN